MKIVFVYLGPTVPEYLVRNMNLIAERFPESPIILLNDSKEEILRLTSKSTKFSVQLVSNPELSWSNTLDNSGFASDFRENFWGKTLARFYSIDEYMSQTPDEPILHIEGDIWISPNFPLNQFSLISQQIAYPLTNIDQGVASTIYFKNADAASLLKSFSEESMRKDKMSTDVSILGELHQAYPGEILILPTTPSPDFDYHEHAQPYVRELMSKNFDFFGGIFDASTWGQFVTGEDAKNNVGFKKVYHHQTHHSVCPANCQFLYSENSGLVAKTPNYVFNIFSLHVHSKNKKIFSIESSNQEIKKYCDDFENKEKHEFIPKIFMKQIVPYLIYRAKLILRVFLGRA